MKNKKLISKTKYAIYLLVVHLICIIFTISKIVIPSWGHWLETTRFLWTSFPTYVCVLIAIFPIVGNVTLILIYTTVLHKIL